ncbi:hypothetical protein [Actinoallomurus iriomotensis]|uniref:Uncharacterized protein n=1 Tax=Actinoallomurus iriomotensis TaxID=478107 RepID=A0A9W6SE17_9ACTN|nr:hypothetical protein [Actinoallomurus iriomotensis]GLY91773.1 hypothetical protein Airi02_097010 [Actinoallomurus iriomotensis]
MIHHVVAISAATTFIGTTRTPPSKAAPAIVRRDGDHHGNGHHNRNVLSSGSPTHNRGYQHTSNGNAGGTNPVQNALCRHVTSCTISQKVNIIQPERPAPAPASPAVEVLPQTIVPQTAAPQTAAPQTVPRTIVPQTRTAPRPRPRPRTPFMYMGPEGFVLMASDGGTGFGTSAGTGAFPLPFGFFG